MKKILILSLICLTSLVSETFAQGNAQSRGYTFNYVARGVPSSAAVTAASSVALASNSGRTGAIIINDGATKCYLSLNQGAAAVAGQGIMLAANGGAYTIDATMLYRGAVTAITASGSTTLVITDFR